MGSSSGKLTVDLSNYQIGGTPLGKAPWEGDIFAAQLMKDGTLTSEPGGYELGLTDGTLEYAFINLALFQGVFLIQDQVAPLGQQTSPEKIVALFGEPYWIDRDDGEIILFYEYRKGEIELQFEFPAADTLGYITLTKSGVLSGPEQRASYGVTKPWPPQ